MIKLFQQTDTTFNSNGDVVINATKAIVHKEDNGAFYLDLECPLSYSDDLTEGRILVADTPQGDQAFRVSNVKKTKFKLSTRAKHVFYDSENYLIQDTNIVNKDANDALDQLNMNTTPASPFTTVGDVTTVNSFRCVRKSYYEAIQTLLERWGGHLTRDNWQIGIRSSIGADNQVTVMYKKNLKEITCQENWNDVVTKLLPVGWDGLMLPEVFVESDTQYSIPYCKTVSFDQSYISEEDYAAVEAYEDALEEDLRAQAEEYVEAHSVPQVNYTLSANLEKLTDIGDTIYVNDKRLGITITTQVIAFDYDCILRKYKNVQFGNFQNGLKNLFSTINNNAENIARESSETVRVTLQEELKQATDEIWGMMGNSYVIYDGNAIMIVDSLPKEDATYVILINSGGIGFSSTGINGTFNSAWTIDGTLDMQVINVINLTADLIKGGTLKLGSVLNQAGILEVYDEENNLIGVMDKDGLKMYGLDGSYVLMNNSDGFSGYDPDGNRIYWADTEQFHMAKAVVEEEITLCGKLRFIEVTTYDSNDQVVNSGIALVSVAED